MFAITDNSTVGGCVCAYVTMRHRHHLQNTYVCTYVSIYVGMYLLYTRGSQTFLVRSTLFRYVKYSGTSLMYEGWNFNSGNYLFTTDTK